ncbi:MAG TPA: FecR domain-containing protein [Burkholderiaceae bacterium]
MTAQLSFSPRHAQKARYWLLRLKSGEISAREVAKVKAWLARDPRHQAAFERERAFLGALAQQHAVFRNPAIGAADGASTGRFRSAWAFRAPALGFAAMMVVVLVMLSPRIWLAARADHSTGAAPSALVLADGTRVVLDARSAIAVAYSDRERRIELLRGHAWFDVAHGPKAPFVVAAQGGRNLDIGTRFEVGIDDSLVSTAVAQGQVEVSSAGDGRQAVRVGAGQVVHYRRGGPVTGPERVDTATVAAWRSGDILLRETAPAVAIERIGRYRKAPVWVVGHIGHGQTISGLFHTDQPDLAIRIIAEQFGAKLWELPGGALVLYAG